MRIIFALRDISGDDKKKHRCVSAKIEILPHVYLEHQSGYEQQHESETNRVSLGYAVKRPHADNT